ncbi:AAA family ATPase [Candidatus Methylospira mobilis]|uniref:AAA family ATPase n=1 Tax=Candidatus Methylospira mobilis TaxID=1808979 RepID=A0A5Q0BHM6_9GAMM|nr:AAA family ATPase [Candidatus Methylospira mobilis]QFY41628.1 AAA family ATPase [Candidatus Methylospira mobilis]
MNVLRFNEALQQAARIALESGLPSQWPVRLVRDIYGRIRFAVNCTLQEYPDDARRRLESALAGFGAYATKGEVMFRDDFANPDAIFNSPDWHETTIPAGFNSDDAQQPDWVISVLDRQIIGQDWLKPLPSQAQHPQRIVFYGLKGGVGRSTALAMAAYGLARAGKRVLLVDFDLESPGLSGLLLPIARVAEFGLVDWFVEDAVGQGEALLQNLVSSSPLAETTTGAIRIAAAMGQSETAYLSKLARIYADIPRAGGAERFPARMQQVLTLLEAQEQPDVVLIDSRAGLHDIAAISITRLADIALLFAGDSAQNWQGYQQLFAHWQHRPDVCRQVRERLAIVQALAPKHNREARAKSFLEQSYELFSNTLYDEIAPPKSRETFLSAEATDRFNPPMEDESAPHFPIRVDWDEVFQEFNPLVRPEHGGVSYAEIDAKFGALIAWITSRVNGG